MFARKKKQYSEDIDPLEGESEDYLPSQRLRRSRRWPYVLLFLAALVLLLPNLVGWLGLHQVAINYFASDIRGSVIVEEFSAGWLQPIEMTGVAVVDDQQQPVLSAATIRTDKSLLALATGSDYGTVEISQPAVFLRMSPDSSNLEDTFVNYLRPSAASDQQASTSSELPAVQLKVTDGQVLLTQMDSNQSWHLDAINGQFQTKTSEAPLQVEIAARITPQAIDDQQQVTKQPPGALTLIGQIDAGSNQLNFDSIDIAVETKQLPMSVVAPVLQRLMGPVGLAGTITGNLQGNVKATDQSVAISIKDIDCRQVFFACPALIEQDQIHIQSLIGNGDIQLTPQLISANEFRVKSDLGRVRANGNFDVQQISQLGTSGQLFDSPFEMDGELDLAQIIAMMPSTLQLHPDLQLQSGEITFQVNSQSNNVGPRRLVVNMDTANLAATRAGRKIVWAKPLRLVGTVSEQDQRLSIERIRCESEFLNIDGQGDLRQAQFNVDGDLRLLTERVGQFVDLDGTSLGGVMKGGVGWRLAGDAASGGSLDDLHESPIEISGEFTVLNPVIETADLPRWAPPEIQVALAGVGHAHQGNQAMALQLNQGQIRLDIGTEQATAILAQPIADAFTADTWVAECRATGRLHTWLAHLQNFVDLGPIQARGQMDVNSKVAVGGDDIRFAGTVFRFDDFRFVGYGIQAAESSVEGQLDGRYDLETGVLELPDMTFVADSVSARGQNLTVAYQDHLQIDGAMAYRANVNRVADWIELSPTEDSIFWFGDAAGTVSFTSDDQGIGLVVDSTITDMAAAKVVSAISAPTGLIQNAAIANRQWNALWQDASVKMTGGLKFNHAFDSIAFSDARIQSSSLSGVVSGKIDDLYAAMNMDISGAWQPDWNQINGLLAEMTGGSLQFSGSRDQRFTIRGPLFASSTAGSVSITQAPTPWVPASLFANAAVGWDSGQVLGLPVGATEFSIALNQSVAQLSTNGIPFAGGRIQMAPIIDLRTANPEIRMERTRIVDNVQLQPETARQWLRYVAPLAADATSAQGNLTVDVESATVPLLAPEDMQISGVVHVTEAALGAGPLAEQLLDSIQQVRQLLKPGAEQREMRTTLQLKAQSIPYLVQDSRVYHKQLDFSHDDLTIRTSGSVGFDQTLQMTASIPIADDWIDGEKYLAGLKGQSLAIPIGGTVARPQIDRSQVAQLSQNLVRQAATSAAQQAVEEKLSPKINQYQQKLNDKLNGGLNKLQGKLQEGLNKNLGLDKLGIGAPSSGNGGVPLQNLLPGQRAAGAEGQPAAKRPDPKELLKGLGDLFN